MRNKFKKTLAVLASVSMCSTILLQFPSGTFSMELPVSAAEGDIEISETNFPDAVFRTFVDNNYDTTDDNVLDADEIAAVTKIDVYNRGITDLTGVEYFTALTELNCSFNQLTSLDVSNNTALNVLSCAGNQLTSLDVSNCAAMTVLACYNNQLTTLDVSNNIALTALSCSSNLLTDLDVINNTALNILFCDSNQLTSLDVSNNTALEHLKCYSNQLTSLDVSNCAALEYLFCDSNQLWKLDLPANYSGVLDFDTKRTITVTDESLDLSAYELDAANFSGGTLDENGILTPDTHPRTVTYTYDVDGENTISCAIKFGIAIDETNFPDDVFRTFVDENYDTTDDNVLDAEEIAAVTKINVSDKGITDLTGVEYFTALTELNCSFNDLTSLDVSNCAAMTDLSCYNNLLTTLDISDCTALTYLDCINNQLTSLDVSNNTALEYLYCSSNQLTSLDVSNCTTLTELNCNFNQLTSLDVSNNTALTALSCIRNLLTDLDVSNNTALTNLNCYSNQLTSLDVSNNTALTNLNCYSNQLPAWM